MLFVICSTVVAVVVILTCENQDPTLDLFEAELFLFVSHHFRIKNEGKGQACRNNDIMNKRRQKALQWQLAK